jgi:hypothetical protein
MLRDGSMSTFTNSFFKLLRNSTALTLLFLPAVLAMNEEGENKKHVIRSSSHGKAASSSGGKSASSSTSIPPSPFFQLQAEEDITKIRQQLTIEDSPRLYVLNGKPFIKGEVPGDGTCFIHTLSLLFPDKKISRDAFAEQLKNALKGEHSKVLREQVIQEFAAELYTQLFFYKMNFDEAAPLEFEGTAISLFAARDDIDFDNPQATIQQIANNPKIMEEMLAGFAQTKTMLSLPDPGLNNIGSFGLACLLFGLNLDVYTPIEKTNILQLRADFPFGGDSPSQAAFFATRGAHVSPLCPLEDIGARQRFAVNEIEMIEKGEGIYQTADYEDRISVLQERALQFSLSKPFSRTDVERLDSDFKAHPYTLNRYNIGEDSELYNAHMPQAPVIHPYHLDEHPRLHNGVPTFSHAASLRAEDLDPSLFPFLLEAQETLKKSGIDPNKADYFYVIQNDPWFETDRLLRPQSWIFPDVDYVREGSFGDSKTIQVAILSPNNVIKLVGSPDGKGTVSVHNSVTSENPKGDVMIISSGPDFPKIAGLQDNKTSFFVSTVAIPGTERAAVTFHTILNDDDFARLQATKIDSLRDLQLWLATLLSETTAPPSSVLSFPYSPSASLPRPELELAPHLTFRTAGANKDAEIKHSAIYVSFLYQETPDTAELIINHRTTGKGPKVRVYNPKAKAYINLGTLPPSMDFREEVFNLSPLIEAVREGSVSTIKTELNFTNGTGDIHSFKIRSGGKTLKEVILGNQDSEGQPGVHVYAGNLQEWSEVKEAPYTFRTTGANKDAETKHSAIYVSFPYQETPGTAYKLIINHRTKAKGPEVRVYDHNAKAYIDLGTLPPSMGFTDEVFNLSPLIEAACAGSSSVPAIKTEVNFTNGTSNIHSFRIQFGEKIVKEVVLGDKDSEEQPGAHVYAGNLQEWSDVQSDDVQ